MTNWFAPRPEYGNCGDLSRFSDAGPAAQKPCDCRPEYYMNSMGSSCSLSSSSPPNYNCFKANCDWWPYQRDCDRYKTSLGRCPVFDGVVYKSAVSVPGLVYLKENRGFSVPDFRDGTTRTPFNYSHGSAGRCVNAVCRNDPPPVNGVRELEAGEKWCDSIPDWGGMIHVSQVSPT